MTGYITEKIAVFFSLVKFEHTLFALPFALTGFFMGVNSDQGEFSLKLLVLIILAMVFARNSAMGFNRWADRITDAKNPRTASREIPSSRLSAPGVMVFVLINSLLFVVVAGMINNLTLILSIPALVILLGYSYLKRFTALSHYGVGLALGIAPSAAYISVTGELAAAPLILSLTVFFWSGSFDILYSVADREFDIAEGLHSIPASVGIKKALVISAAGHIPVPILLWLLYSECSYFGVLYIAGTLIFCLLLIYQHTIVKSNDLSRLNQAFFTSNGLASVIFAILAIADIYLLNP
ncbi:MAG: putative 4-hydroxybenzoate polyprenyltransferase [Bacteroidales bacterium]|nr:putative 4-hydroxybenzoate polyprenyltransferase [Bacteroidales bacterium]MDD2424669.1 putative 4-hydroxybenzoate polyprenyltransferase [Bacteroidales bacterium]MDD3989111.1 putative 4-hydroxybenzoate polyprenyltransferase [Bacteroidales bacterium]MDD4638132.1 putative 4-hydroxybenzoate polyprenyltransferase [Bacteroidales bacterium]